MIVAFLGPTASGKSEAALSFALGNNGEVINCDALQVYRGTELLTCAPLEGQMKGIPHHLYSFLDVDQPFDVRTYQSFAREKTNEVLARGKTPVFVGGTGLYLKAALYDYRFEEETEVDLSEFEGLTNEELHKRLKEVDPAEAEAIHPNNRRRALRALAIYLSRGKPKSRQYQGKDVPMFEDIRLYGLGLDREQVYSNIEVRTRRIFEDSRLEKEIFPLLLSHGDEEPGMKAIGISESRLLMEGKIDRDETIARVIRKTKQYAKRQLTFFRHQFKEVEWIR